MNDGLVGFTLRMHDAVWGETETKEVGLAPFGNSFLEHITTLGVLFLGQWSTSITRQLDVARSGSHRRVASIRGKQYR